MFNTKRRMFGLALCAIGGGLGGYYGGLFGVMGVFTAQIGMAVVLMKVDY